MKKAYVNKKLCVACGTCLGACRLGAISISDGVNASVDFKKCVGCGMCSKLCPASIIDIKEEMNNE